MLTQSLNTSISSTKAAPVPFAKPDQFCGLTGHAGLVARNFRTGRTRRSTARMSWLNMSIR